MVTITPPGGRSTVPDEGCVVAMDNATRAAIAAAVTAEREACARVCDGEFWRAMRRGWAAGVAATNCAVAIRARGEKR